MKKLIYLLYLTFAAFQLNAQAIISVTDSGFVLSNKLFSRTLFIDRPNHAFYTKSIISKQSGYEFVRPVTCKEFSFFINGKEVNAGNTAKMFDYVEYEIIKNENSSTQLTITLKGIAGKASAALLVKVNYEIYDDLPTVRKWIEIQNRSGKECLITDLQWENINMEIYPPSWIPQVCSFADVYGTYGQNIQKTPYIGRTDDPAILVYNPLSEDGAIIGNEAPAIMKRTAIFPDSTNIGIGMGFMKDDFPFKRYLKQNQSFVSPKGFIQIYHGKKWQDAFEGDLATFIRKYMGVKLFMRKQMPHFIYNTWNPFGQDINEQLIKESSDILGQTGCEYFIMDDGWQDNYGDWNVDRKKFPNGMKPVCDYIRSKGMIPGLWISLCAVSDKSVILKEHPEWVVRDLHGKMTNLDGDSPEVVTMNLSTGWYNYINSKINYYADSLGIGYFKIDLASVRSAHKLNNIEAGDYSKGRAHKDKDESLYMLYEQELKMFDDLKVKHPELYIDYTFENYGHVYGIDYSVIQHADGDWLSNIGDQFIRGDTSNLPKAFQYLRTLAWERARVVPSSTMIIGNMQMNWLHNDIAFASLFSATHIMLGDPRNLTPEQIEFYKKGIKWIKEMDDKYNYLKYYQTSDVFDKPSYSGWDGFARFNKDKDGGLLCFFRNDNPEQSRKFSIPWVNKSNNYKIRKMITGEIIAVYTGQQLITEGLPVEITNRNSALILEIEGDH